MARTIVGGAATVKAIFLGFTILPRLEYTRVRLPMIEGMPPASASAVAVVLLVWLLMAAAFTAGWRTRIAGGVLAVAMTIFSLLDQQFYSNHLYLHTLLVVLLTIADSGAAHSLDARRRGGSESVPAWPITLVCLQLSVVYGFAAFAKVTPEFLSGGILYESWLLHGLLPLPEPLRRWEVMGPLAVLAFLTEVFLAFAFWLDWLRRLAVFVGVGMHGVIILTMGSLVELSIFAALMFSIYVIFEGRASVTVRAEPREA
jgi:hypothetical protein